MSNILNARHKNLSKTEAEWTTLDPVLLEGEIAFSKDTNKIKIGNGTSKWSVLEYCGAENELNLDNGSGMFSINSITSTASGQLSFAEGKGTQASGVSAHSEGTETTASGSCSHAEGSNSIARGAQSHAEGQNSFAIGDQSHAEGYATTANTSQSHAEGGMTIASGLRSHAEGSETTASSSYSHAEGSETKASGSYSHAENNKTIASGEGAHAEGNNTTASGNYSHAGGYQTNAAGPESFTHGSNLTANYSNQAVFGKYNDNKSTNILEVGNGSLSNKFNLFSVTTNGDILYRDNNVEQSLKTNLAAKQDTLTAGDNIIISDNTISADIPEGVEISYDLTNKEFIFDTGDVEPEVHDSIKIYYTDNNTYDFSNYFIANKNNELITLSSNSLIKYTTTTTNSNYKDGRIFYYINTQNNLIRQYISNYYYYFNYSSDKGKTWTLRSQYSHNGYLAGGGHGYIYDGINFFLSPRPGISGDEPGYIYENDLTNGFFAVSDKTLTEYNVEKLVLDDAKYKLVDTVARNQINSKQDTLVSGTNIKTINNQSILGSGNIEIQGDEVTAESVASAIEEADTFQISSEGKSNVSFDEINLQAYGHIGLEATDEDGYINLHANGDIDIESYDNDVILYGQSFHIENPYSDTWINKDDSDGNKPEDILEAKLYGNAKITCIDDEDNEGNFVVKPDGAYFNDEKLGLENTLRIADVYSEDEQVVGVWTDGRPIYQRVIKTQLLSTVGRYTITRNDLNFANCRLISSTHTLIYPNGETLDTPFVSSDESGAADIYAICGIENNKLSLRIKTGSNRSNLVLETIVSYTKTTDAEGSGKSGIRGIYNPENIYKEEETVIGSYLGKPLYQKTLFIPISSLTIESNYVAKYNLSDNLYIERLVDIDGQTSYNGNPNVCLPYYSNTIPLYLHGSSTYIIFVTISENAVSQWFRDSNRSFIVTIKYTKTTDAEGSGNYLSPQACSILNMIKTKTGTGTSNSNGTLYLNESIDGVIVSAQSSVGALINISNSAFIVCDNNGTQIKTLPNTEVNYTIKYI